MRQGVFRIQPSVHAAYRAQEAQVGTSGVSVSNTRQEIETHPAAALVRSSARTLAPLIEHVGGARAPWLPGSQVKIVDGNAMEARAHRRKALRGVEAGALPGKSLVVYEPAAGLVSDVFPGEDGHAQERSLFTAVLRTVQAGDLWIADRNFCPRELRCDIAARGASLVIRQHRGLPCEIVSPLHPLGRVETGHIAAQRVRVVDAQDGVHGCRRLRIKLNHPTRDGATLLSILTNVPARPLSGKRGARRSQKRWTLETACQYWEAYFHSEINTLGYPKAALFGFCLACVASKVLAVVLAA